jgi:hypothetical protein
MILWYDDYMTEFTLRERSTTTRHVTVFIPYPAEMLEDGDGGGWSYTATADHHNVSIEFMGNMRRKLLPTLINLMEIAAKEDKNRNEEFGSPSFGFESYDRDELEEFEDRIEELKTPTIGLPTEDFWIINGASVDRNLRHISTITLMRASNRYVVLEIGNPQLSFNAHELEAVTALLKEFLPEEEAV